MMKYTDKYWKLLMPFMKKRLNKRYGKEYTKELLVKADGVYRGMLNRVDDVGEENPMAANIYECLVVLAIWKEGFYYHFTQCPLNNFARREGCLEVLPVMCGVDFLTAKLMHFKLHREHTLAGGGEVCDYWYVGDGDK